MFYSNDILISKKYGLGIVWLAATLSKRAYFKKITKKDLIAVDISIACKFILSPPEPLALRLTSNLLYGIIKIYNRQVQFCYNDVHHMVSQIKNEFLNWNNNTTLLEISEARPDTITIVERENFDFGNELPLTLPQSDSQNISKTLIEFGWVKNYNNNQNSTTFNTTDNINMKKNSSKRSNISIPEISINITDLHEKSFDNDQYYDLLLSQEGLLQESLNIFNDNYLETDKYSLVNKNYESKKNNELEKNIHYEGKTNGINTINDEDNINLFDEIKDILIEEHSFDNLHTNSNKSEKLMKELNIQKPVDFEYELNINDNDNQILNQGTNSIKKRKRNNFFDESIFLDGNQGYYSQNTFNKLYTINHYEKKIKLLTNKFKKNLFNNQLKYNIHEAYNKKIQSYYSCQYISPNQNFDSDRYLYNSSLNYLREVFHNQNNNNLNSLDQYSSIENYRNPNFYEYEDTTSKLLFSKAILKELQQKQENSKLLLNSFSFNNMNLDFDLQEINMDTNKINENNFILPEDLINTTDKNDTEKQYANLTENNEFIYNLDLEPEIFRLNEKENQLNKISNNFDQDNIPLLNGNSLDENHKFRDNSNRSTYPWNIISFQTPVRNANTKINSHNNSSSKSTHSSIISFGSNLETPTKKNRRISFGKNMEISPISDDSSYQRHNRLIFDNNNDDIVSFPMNTKINDLLVGKEDSLRFYNYIQDIIEISNSSFFPKEIQNKDNEQTISSIFFSDLVPSSTSIKINKKKLNRSLRDEDNFETSPLPSTIHPASCDMAVEAFYHVLVLSTNNLIKPIQRENYGDIKLEMINI
ncbi:Rec8 like protein-domain-containing protein [Neocallimastix lanati (nom. inval.)]|nr:Rec8 like protein-domain-containing protein [Neocallimastix sp. JGI-2020a]